MNYLNSSDVGGMYLHADDLRFTHAAYGESFKNLTGGMAQQDYRLYGAVVTDDGSFYGVTEGAVVIDGEICSVEAHDIPNISGQIPYWVIEETDDPNGIEEFKNQVTNSTYKLRRGVLASSSTPPADYPAADMKTLLELLAQSVDAAYGITASFSAISTSLTQLNQRLGTWQNFTPNLTGAAIATQLQTNFRYRLSLEKTLYLNCHFTFSIGINGLTSFTIDIPAGLKSNSAASFMAGFSNTSIMVGTVDNIPGNDGQIIINTTGFGIGTYVISFAVTFEVK